LSEPGPSILRTTPVAFLVDHETVTVVEPGHGRVAGTVKEVMAGRGRVEVVDEVVLDVLDDVLDVLDVVEDGAVVGGRVVVVVVARALCACFELPLVSAATVPPVTRPSPSTTRPTITMRRPLGPRLAGRSSPCCGCCAIGLDAIRPPWP
jgi:hypothetical protein